MTKFCDFCSRNDHESCMIERNGKSMCSTCRDEHRFPNAEMLLLADMKKHDRISTQESAILFNLTQRYIELRSWIFHNF